MLRSEPRIVLALRRGEPFSLLLPLAASSAPGAGLRSPSRRQRCRWKEGGCPRAALDGSVFAVGRAGLPDRKRCQSSWALEVALEAAAPGVRVAAIAQKRFFGTSFIIRSLLWAWPVLFSCARFPRLFRVCFTSLFAQSWEHLIGRLQQNFLLFNVQIKWGKQHSLVMRHRYWRLIWICHLLKGWL